MPCRVAEGQAGPCTLLRSLLSMWHGQRLSYFFAHKPASLKKNRKPESGECAQCPAHYQCLSGTQQSP